MKALLIEPDVERRQRWTEALQRHGFVPAAAEIETACALQKADCCPLVVLAVEPVEKGVDLCRRLRGIPCDRPFWLLASADGRPSGRAQDLLAAGADDVLPLPMEDSHLEARLALARRHVERQQPAGSLAGWGPAEAADTDAHREPEHPDAMFRNLVENVPDLVFVLDAAGFVQFTNHGLPRGAGGEAHGTHCSQYFAAGHVPPLLHMMRRALDTKSVQILPVADQWSRWWQARLVPIVRSEIADTVLIICTDMSDDQRAVDLLRESEQRYHLIAENVTDVIWIAEFPRPLDLPDRPASNVVEELAAEILDRWRFSYVSPSVQRVMGYAVREFLAIDLESLLTAESRCSMRGFLTAELVRETEQDGDPGRSRVFEIEQFARDGRACHCEAAATFLRNVEGRITGVLGVTRDITQRRRADDALRESEAKFRGLMQNMPDLVVVVDRHAIVQYVSRSASSTALREVSGKDCLDYLRPEYREAVQAAIQAAFETRRVQQCDAVDISGLCWSCRVVPIVEGNEGEVHSAMAICTDVTDKKRAEAEVQKEQDVLRQMLELFERDRELAAFEIHDGVAQQLTGAMLNFEASGQLAATSPAEAKRTYREGLRLLRQGIEETRRLISGLRPPVLDAFGIVPAIEQLIRENLAIGGGEIELAAEEQFDRLARPLENAVFRIVQESLTNARRYSQSKKIRVELERTGNRLRLVVRDWGIGFDPVSVADGHFGVKGIRERARLLGGSASFDTAPGKGTSVVVELPLLPQTPGK